jgi:hypothetical protein
MNLPQRPDWQGSPVELAELFRLVQGRNRRVRCLIFTHEAGFELRLMFGWNAELPLRFQVCPTNDETLAVGEQWKAALVEKGWCAPRDTSARRPRARRPPDSA